MNSHTFLSVKIPKASPRPYVDRTYVCASSMSWARCAKGKAIMRQKIVMSAKNKEQLEKELKQMKKILRKAEEEIAMLTAAQQNTEKHQKDYGEAFEAHLHELRTERVQWESMFERQNMQQKLFLQQVQHRLAGSAQGLFQEDNNTVDTIKPKMSEEEEIEEIEEVVSKNIMEAISRVGFPDNYKESISEGNELNNEWADAVDEPPVAESPTAPSTSNRNGESSVGKVHLPTLTIGCDDIQLMDLLHKSLAKFGYYASDEDTEDWYYGESTQSAVLTFQAANGLPENGSVSLKEWKILLDNDPKYDFNSTAIEPLENEVADNPLEEISVNTVVESPSRVDHKNVGVNQEASKGNSSFKALQEGDGGIQVRRLQLALGSKGFCVTSDEAEFWYFGDSTITALKTFQACNNLPESGIVDEDCWKILCEGDLDECNIVESADGYDIDRAHEGVFLLGEGRYENPSRLKSDSN